MREENLRAESSSEFTISGDRSRIDFDFVHRFLSQSYWSPGLPKDVLRRAIDGSLCFSGFLNGSQIAFARVIADQATFACLCDVFVAPGHQGRGFGNQLIEAVLAHPSLQGLRRFLLATRDAHGLYAKNGFEPLARPESMIEILRPDVYRQS